MSRAMPTDTETFHWSEIYSVHIAVLDEQHRQLIKTVSELHQALRMGEGNRVLDSVLIGLVNYAGEHFATEESLMTRYGYPGLSLHRAQHQNFRNQLQEFMEAYKAGKPCVPVSIMLYVEQWLRSHLLKSDQLYSSFLNALGVH